MSILTMVENSPFKKSWLSRAARISSPSRFSKIIHGAVIPNRFERQLLASTFSKLGIATQSDLLDAIEQNAKKLKQEIDLDDVFTVGDSEDAKKKETNQNAANAE